MGYVMLVSRRVTVFFPGPFPDPNLTESAEPNQETWERSPKIKKRIKTVCNNPRSSYKKSNGKRRKTVGKHPGVLTRNQTANAEKQLVKNPRSSYKKGNGKRIKTVGKKPQEFLQEIKRQTQKNSW